MPELPETKTYIGVKLIEAWPQERDGKPGYAVRYRPDGYTSWSPKDVFEAAYLPLAEGHLNKISQADVDSFIAKSAVATLGEKTTVVQATLRNGFEMVEGSSCVDPKNYNEALGTGLCLEKIKGNIWGLLGFVLQWGMKGLAEQDAAQ